ncbi:MAG TPA: glycosyltransferase family 39 protein [Acidimicrobiales bacterium]|nr:glycosyltransferase family 39 protein [Acidimicrobiales bacterium]
MAVGPVRAPSRPPSVALGAGAGLVTFLAYLPGLGRSLDFDSAQTVGMFVKPGPPWGAFRSQAAFNNHPFFSFLEQLVRVVTGRTDAATMRLLPILCGAAAVGALTWFAARRHGATAGLVAGALLAANPTFATLSRSVRGYSLLVLCAIVATILVVDDRPGSPAGWRDVAYVAVAGVGLATHLYMFPVLAAHAGIVVARGGLDSRWRMRFAGAAGVAVLAYAGMAASMVDTMGGYDRVLQTGLPWRVAVMATGGGWASAFALPLVATGAALLLRRSRAARGAAVALASVLVLQWAVLQSSALTPRYFVWLVPAAAYLAAVAVGRLTAAGVLGVASFALAVSVLAAGYTDDPTAYRQAAAIVHQVNAAGGRSCVVDIGVAPMLAYLDTPQDFAAVTDPAELDACDAVFVTSWWPSDAEWYARDRAVIAAAEAQFPHRQVIPGGDRTLVLSRRPLPA